MKNIESRLLPLLACLAVLGAALLPQRFSLLRDRSLDSTIYTEEAAPDSSLSSHPTTLSERIGLLYQLEFDRDNSIITTVQEQDDPDLLEQTALTALKALAADSVIPMAAVPDAIPGLSGTRSICRSRLTGSSASFLQLSGGDAAGFYFSLVLDEEAGAVCGMELVSGNAAHTLGLSEQMAGQYYGCLGLEAELAWSNQESARYRLTGTEGFFQVFQVDTNVGAWSIRLEPDDLWSLSDHAARDETGLDTE